jgi:hypothetical protein
MNSVALTNEDFFDALGRDIPDGACMWGTGFPQTPGQAKGRQWGGQRISYGAPLPPEIQTLNNNYGAVGFYWRTRHNDNLAGIGALLLDDCGTKAPPWTDLPLPPSYVVETSLGNCQALYFFKDPASIDTDQYKAICNELLRRGYGDPDAKSVTRYFRLPEGTNNKEEYAEPFAHVCRAWSPDLRYSLDDIKAAFKLALDDTSRANGNAVAAAPADDDEADPALAERADRALNACSMREGEPRNGWLELMMGHTAAGGTAAARLSWCEGQPGHNPEKVPHELASLSIGGGITERTWYARANEQCPDWDGLPTLTMGGLTPEELPAAKAAAAAAAVREVTDGGRLAWASKHVLTNEEADELVDPIVAIPNLVIDGHLGVYVAQPMGGKTTIFTNWVAPKLVDAGYEVYYVNADTGAGDAKAMIETARIGGFEMMTPELKGNDMSDIVEMLEAMVKDQYKYNGVVFIFDTLKKMADVITKSKAKALYKTLRALTAKGMTIILLAHTNKYKGDDGKPVYEGTGDLRADVDELIYLIPEKHDDGSMTVSTDPNSDTSKVRGVFVPITFEITADRDVTLSGDYVDVTKGHQERKRYEAAAHLIEAAKDAIHAEFRNETGIVGQLRERFPDEKPSRRRISAILSDFSRESNGMRQFSRKRGMKNEFLYTVILDASTFR